MNQTNKPIALPLPRPLRSAPQLCQLPGQQPVPSETLAPVLDDAIVAWSLTAHSQQLHLVRWSSLEYFLVASMNPSERQRPVVRVLADTLLQVGWWAGRVQVEGWGWGDAGGSGARIRCKDQDQDHEELCFACWCW